MEGLIGLLILVISAIGWIANAMQEQKAKEQQQQKGGPQRPQRKLQEEIENFLKEIQPAQEDEKPQPAPRRPQPERKPKPARESRRAQARQEKRTGNTPPSRSSTSSSSANRPTSSFTPSAIEASQPPSLLEVGLQPGEKSVWDSPGAAGDRQLQDFLHSEAATGFSQDVRNLLSQDQLLQIQALAQKHRGRGGPSGTALSIPQMLASDNIHQAFVINEILKRPRSLR